MSETHDDHNNAAPHPDEMPHDHAPTPMGFATQLASPQAAPIQAVLSPDQFRKIENMQRSIGKLSRRLTLMSLFNLLILILLGWSWYNDHQKLVDGYINRFTGGKTEAPAVKPAAAPAAQAPAPVPSKPIERDPDQAATAQKLFDEAKALEAQGNYTEAMAKLDQVKSFSSVDWPQGLKEMMDHLESQKRAHPPGDFFGVH
jgi:hypothetical protein